MKEQENHWEHKLRLDNIRVRNLMKYDGIVEFNTFNGGISFGKDSVFYGKMTVWMNILGSSISVEFTRMYLPSKNPILKIWRLIQRRIFILRKGWHTEIGLQINMDDIREITILKNDQLPPISIYTREATNDL
jgi:hypothetical protein